GPRRDPRRGHGGLPRGDGGRRPGRSHPQGRRCARPRRRAPDRRQGPRDGPDRRPRHLSLRRCRTGLRCRGGTGRADMSGLWTSAEAAAATGGRATRAFAATGLSIDTRTLAPGDLFVALKDLRDGHDFVRAALDKGAAAALVSRVPEGCSEADPLLIVADVLAALTALGQAGRARARAKVIAVTGSVGKTSTKEMLRAVLAGQGRVHAAEASFNNHWGVPVTLARMPADADFAVVEIGMNHPGEIAPLARLARPHVAMITTVAPAHLEAFESLEGIAREKAAIFQGLEPGGIAVIPSGLAVTPILAAAAAGGARTL